MKFCFEVRPKKDPLVKFWFQVGPVNSWFQVGAKKEPPVKEAPRVKSWKVVEILVSS